MSLLLAVSTVTYSQPAITIAADTLISTKRGSIVGTVVNINNLTEFPANVRLKFDFPEGIASLNPAYNRRAGYAPTGVSIVPNGKVYLPVRFQIAGTMKSGLHEVRMSVIDTAAIVVEHLFKIKVVDTRQVVLNTLSSSIISYQEEDSIRVRLQIRNIGNTPEKIKLVSSLPGGIDRRFYETALALEASQDTLLTLLFPKDKILTQLEQFTVNISGLYETNELFGAVGVIFQNASSSRKFTPPLHQNPDPWSIQQNKISVILRNPYTQNMSWQMGANGIYTIKKGKLSFNNQTYISTGYGAKPLISNTWIGYEQDNKGLVLGNITETLEKFVVGRGAKAYIHAPDKSQRFEAGFIERSYNLLGDEYTPAGRYGISAFGKASFGKADLSGGKKYTAIALYDQDVYDNSESILLPNTFEMIVPRKNRTTHLTLDVSPAIVRPLQTEGGMPANFKPALAAGLNFNTTMKRLSVNSSNYYSTAYYPGLRRGALQLSERINYRMGKVASWASFILYESAPRSFSSGFSTQNHLVTSRSEIGLSFPVSPFSYFSFSPRLEKERGRYEFIESGIEEKEIESRNITGNFNWRSRNSRRNGFLAFETGSITSPFSKATSWHTRGNISYSLNWFAVNTTLQRGNFSLIESMNAWYNERPETYRTTISATARKDFFTRKLQTEFGLNYIKDSNSGVNWTGNITGYYRVFPKTTVMTTAQVFRYANSLMFNSTTLNFQAGLVQALPRNKSESGQRYTDLHLFYFLDANGNGTFDEGETPAQNFIVKIGPIVFVTDKNGEILYRQVPSGTHNVSMTVQQGWYTRDIELTLEGRKLRREVPLQKTGSLKGSLVLKTDIRISRQFDHSLEGYSVIARNVRGEAYVTRTDDQGHYLLFLPEGQYELTLNPKEFPENIYTNDGTLAVQIEAGKINEAPPFELLTRKKTIEVKKFSSP